MDTTTVTDRWPMALADVPPEWLDTALVGAYQQREAIAAATPAMAELVDVARARRDAASAAVAASGTMQAVADLVDAAGALLAAEAAQAALPTPIVDQQWIRDSVGKAATAVEVAGRALVLHPLSFEEETEAWRQHVRRYHNVVDPPVATDAERDLAELIRPARDSITKWRDGRQQWAEALRHGGFDAAAHMRAAVGYIQQAHDYAESLAQLNALIDEVNTKRAARGLVWSATR